MRAPVRPKDRVELLGVPLDPLSMSESLALVDGAMKNRVLTKHVVVNVAKLVQMRADEALRRDVVESDIIGIDGMGIVLAARILGKGKLTRVTGVDLMMEILKLCAEKGYRPYILGAKESVLLQAVEKLKIAFPTLQFAGFRNGYFSVGQEKELVSEIRNSGADCLFVAMSSPAKERFTELYKDQLGVSFIMGVGGSVDVIAGLVKRAPRWMQNSGLEWAYRVWQEPKRMWKRYLVTNTKFAGILFLALITRAVPFQSKPALEKF